MTVNTTVIRLPLKIMNTNKKKKIDVLIYEAIIKDNLEVLSKDTIIRHYSVKKFINSLDNRKSKSIKYE